MRHDLYRNPSFPVGVANRSERTGKHGDKEDRYVMSRRQKKVVRDNLRLSVFLFFLARVSYNVVSTIRFSGIHTADNETTEARMQSGLEMTFSAQESTARQSESQRIEKRRSSRLKPVTKWKTSQRTDADPAFWLSVANLLETIQSGTFI